MKKLTARRIYKTNHWSLMVNSIGAIFISVFETLFFFRLITANSVFAKSLICFIVPFLVILGLNGYKELIKHNNSPYALWMLFKALFSCAFAVGNRIENNSDWFSVVISFIGVYCLFDPLIGVCYKLKGIKSIIWVKGHLVNKHSTLFTIGGILVLDTILLIVCYPSLITYDTMTQSQMAMGIIEITDHHPVLLTLLLRLLLSTGILFGDANLGIFLLGLFQIILMAIASGYAVDIIHRITNNRAYKTIAQLIYVFNPFYALYTITIGKDTLTAILFLLYLESYIETIYIKKQLTRRLFIQIVLFSVLVSLIRHNAMYVVFLSIPLLCFVINKSRVLIALAIVVLSVLSIHFIYHECLGIKQSSDAEKYSIFMQTTAKMLIDHEEELSSSELHVIESFIGDSESVTQAYNPQLSDPIKSYLYNEDITISEKAAFFTQWGCLFFRYPQSYISAITDNTYGYFYIDYSRDIKPRFWLKESVDYFNRMSDMGLSIRSETDVLYLSKCVERLQTSPIVGIVLNIAFYVWILIYVLFTGVAHKDKKQTIVAITVVLYLLTILAGPVNGYYRYVYPIVVAVPLMQSISKSKLFVRDKKTLLKSK